MKFTKPALTYEQQADRLLERGMAGDRALMISRLMSVNYYRLTAYWLPFRQSDDTFRPGTTFDEVWTRYAFDRRLRLLVMDAIERIEIAVRTQLAYHHAHAHGPFGYADDPASLPKLTPQPRSELLVRIQEETKRSKEQFVEHFQLKYGSDHAYLPVWMATETMSFGTVLTFFRGCGNAVKQDVASCFGMPWKVFDSWLLTLTAVRNICAHHGRLWNRELGVKPFIPRIDTYPDWHTPTKVENNRMFAVLTICRYCLRCVAPQSDWANRLRALLTAFPRVPLRSMGFPVNWERSLIWA